MKYPFNTLFIKSKLEIDYKYHAYVCSLMASMHEHTLYKGLRMAEELNGRKQRRHGYGHTSVGSAVEVTSLIPMFDLVM